MNINQTIKKSFSRAAMMLLAIILFSMTAQTAWAETVDRVKYIDANGDEQTRDGVIVLDGSETTLGENGGTKSSPKEVWYICDKNLSYTTTLSSYNYCNVNIILADGKEMKVENSSSDAISFFGSLGIYGQSTGTNKGKLTATGTYSGIFANNDVVISSAEVTAEGQYAIYAVGGGVSITGGKITAKGLSNGINAKNDVTIIGAEVTATAKNSTGLAIYVWSGSVRIEGGKVTAKGSSNGINAKNDVTIIRAEVTATATDDSPGGQAIYAIYGSISIEGGKVTANGTYSGIDAKNGVTIIGAEVTATATYSSGRAIYVWSGSGSVSITGGKVTANGTEYGIFASNDVTISNAEVTATADGSSGYAIYSCNGGVSITGGKVTANGKYYGIGASGSDKDITISGAEVTATADGSSGYAIYCSYGVSITGGKVTATGTNAGISAYNGCVVLDWTNATDFIMASSYEVGDGKVVKTADGKRFVAFTVDNTNPESPVESGSAIIAGTVSDLTTIAGKMLRPLDGYCVSLPEGLNIVGKTPGFVIGSVSYYQIAAGESVIVEASRQGVEFTGANMPAGTTFNVDYTQATFTMPADANVAITGVRYWVTEVAYIDAAGNQATTPASTKVYVLDGSETTLGEEGTENSPTETWYLCNTNLNYTSTLYSNNYSNVNIILADGVVMSVEPSSSCAINILGSLGIYGQSTGTNRGALIATAKGASDGIYAQNDVTICSAEVTATGGDAIHTSMGGVSITGGKVTANGKYYGIHADASGKDITIKDAEVTATANGSSGYAIYSCNGGVSITGGKVTANGSYCGIRAYGSGKDVTISGAEVTVTGDSGYAISSDRGDVTIKDAEVKATATGTSGIAIYSYEGGVSITGGKVTANGKYNGIHADVSGKDITIKDAEVTATADGSSGYAIYSCNGGVSITGGKVTANGKYFGIGAGGSDKDITISGAEVTATGKYAIGSLGAISITDGSTVTANGTSYGIEASGSDKDVTIKEAEVTAKATGTSGSAIYTNGGSVSITGGEVTANGKTFGVEGAITINDGTVSITGATAISNINSYVVNGGKVTLNSTSGDVYKVTFDGNEWSDIPEVSLYSGSTVAEPTTPARKGYIFGGWKNGSTLYDFNMPVTGNLTLVSVWEMKTLTHTDITIADIADQICTGSEIKPAVSIKDGETDLTEGVDYDLAYSDNIHVGTATVTITGKDGYVGTVTKEFAIMRQMKDLFAGGNQWTGYVAEEDLELPAGLTAYVITALGEESATASALSYIPQGVPVLLSREDKDANLYLASAGSGTAPTTNLLKVATAAKEVTVGECYVLYQDEFVLYGTGTLPAGTIYLPESGTAGARRLSIGTGGDTTGMEDVRWQTEEGSSDWYSIDGRKLDSKPTKKGLYIHNGKKEVVK